MIFFFYCQHTLLKSFLDVIANIQLVFRLWLIVFSSSVVVTQGYSKIWLLCSAGRVFTWDNQKKKKRITHSLLTSAVVNPNVSNESKMQKSDNISLKKGRGIKWDHTGGDTLVFSWKKKFYIEKNFETLLTHPFTVVKASSYLLFKPSFSLGIMSLIHLTSCGMFLQLGLTFVEHVAEIKSKVY